MPRPNVEHILKAAQHVKASEQSEMHNEPRVAMHHATLAIESLLLWQRSLVESRKPEEGV